MYNYNNQSHHTSNSRGCMGVNGEALQLHTVYKSRILTQVTRESVSVLQVMRESISGTASHVCCVWTCNETEGSYDKIIITIVQNCTRKIITHLLPLALLLTYLCTHKNTDGNKLIFFSIALYYGDTYIYTETQHCSTCLLSNLRVKTVVYMNNKMILNLPWTQN